MISKEVWKNKKVLILIILLVLITVSSTTVTVILLMKNAKQADYREVYPPVSKDAGAAPIDEVSASQQPINNPEGGGAVSLTYSKEVVAPKGDGVASIIFQNPAKSNHSIAIQLHITDKVLIEKLGKTGRTAADKAKIEDAEGYDSEKSRMIIAESGLLTPGYKLLKLQLRALPDGTVLPKGSYNAVYYILAFDKETNERAVINMQIPITLTISE